MATDIEQHRELAQQIRRAHDSACPTPANPAWQNCHHDCGVLLAYIDALNIEVENLRTGSMRKEEVLHMVSIGLSLGAIQAADVEVLLPDGPERMSLKALVNAALGRPAELSARHH